MKMLLLSAVLSTLALNTIAASPLQFPEGEKGIGFDDLTFAPSIHKVLVPGGRTGHLMLIDPETEKIETVGGFSTREKYGGGHGEGITSADEGGGYLFVTDRTSRQLDVVDEQTLKVVANAPLAAGPDYVRCVADTNEVWVTEPRAEAIEIFSSGAAHPPSPVHTTAIPVKGGPESLIIDHARARAYTNLWTGTTVAIDLKARTNVASWPNGCKGSRGIALDQSRGFLFVGCEEGKASVLDVNSGKSLGQVSSGDGVDIIAYSPKLAHLYLPGGDSATMATISISGDGKPAIIGVQPTAPDAHCVATDDRGHVYVCDPPHGRILVFRDSMTAPSPPSN